MASSKSSRTSRAPSPMYFCTNSDPTTLRNEASVLWATALARMVLPVPGGPCSKTPFGGSIPTAVKRSGLLRGSSTISLISEIWLSRPPICSKCTSGASSISIPKTAGSRGEGRTHITAKDCWFKPTWAPGLISSSMN